MMRWHSLLLVAALGARALAAGEAQAPKAQAPAQKQPRPKAQTVRNPLNELLDEAQHAIDQNQFAAAVAPLQKFIAEEPDVAYAHFQLAFAFTALDRAEEARAEYLKAIARDPKMAEAHLNLGILLLKSDPAGAVKPLAKAVELLPSASRPRFLLGVALERSGDPAGASEAFAAALRLDPQDYETTLHLGQMNLMAKRPADALPRFRAALGIQPGAADALLGVAQSLDAQKKPEAAAAYREYLVARPADQAARARLVHFLVEQEQFDEALKELEAGPGQARSEELLKLRADIQIGQKKWTEALKTLGEALELAPRDPALHGGLGRIYLQVRDFPAAERELKSALAIDRTNLLVWKDLSSTYYLSGNYPAALAAMDVIAKVETPGPGTWFIRALCYDKLNQPEPALDAYQRFLALDGNKNPDQVWQAQQRSKVLRRVLEKKR